MNFTVPQCRIETLRINFYGDLDLGYLTTLFQLMGLCLLPVRQECDHECWICMGVKRYVVVCLYFVKFCLQKLQNTTKNVSTDNS
jgi:hypothetical protein